MKQISVIVPVFNSEKYLKECIDSILLQSRPFYEIILVDDGSIDRSLEICNEYAKQKSCIKVISKENNGPGSARNAGILSASGDYIVFIDSDDFVKSNMCEILGEALERKDAEVMMYNATPKYDIHFPEGKLTYTHIAAINKEMVSGEVFIKKSFPNKYSVSICLCAFSRDFLVNNRLLFIEGHLFEDVAFFLECMCSAKRVYAISEVLYYRRYRPESVTTGEYTDKKIGDLCEIQHYCYEFLKKNRKFEDNFWSRYMLKSIINALLHTVNTKEGKKKHECIGQYSLLMKQILNGCDVTWETEVCRNILDNNGNNTIITHKYADVDLNDNKTIAFYGIGNNTHAYLEMYKRFVNEINSRIIFILTSPNTKTYMERPVISYKEVSSYIDAIVIPSCTYENEMKANLIGVGYDEKKIHLVHTEDLFDSYTALTLLDSFLTYEN